jgi:hypothetical protein
MQWNSRLTCDPPLLNELLLPPLYPGLKNMVLGQSAIFRLWFGQIISRGDFLIMKGPPSSAKIGISTSPSILIPGDEDFEPLSPMANKSQNAKHFDINKVEAKTDEVESQSDEKIPGIYTEAPPVSGLMRRLRKILGLTNNFGKLLHPKQWSSPNAPVYDESVDPLNLSSTSGESHPMSRTYFDTRVEPLETKLWHGFFQPQGDQARLSFSLFEDIWHLLTVDLPLMKVLLIEISIELLLILTTTILLTLLSLATGENTHETTGELFVFKLLLSLSTVRLSTDSVWGWREGPVSPPVEVILLSLHSWLHWLLLNIASAIVVARAMRPLKQVRRGRGGEGGEEREEKDHG